MSRPRFAPPAAPYTHAPTYPPHQVPASQGAAMLQRSYNMLKWELEMEAPLCGGRQEEDEDGDWDEGGGSGEGGRRVRGNESGGGGGSGGSGESGGSGGSGVCEAGFGAKRQTEEWVLEAIKTVEKAVRMVPSEAFRVYEMAATGMGQLGHLDQADELIEKALAAHDANARGLMVKGEHGMHGPDMAFCI